MDFSPFSLLVVKVFSLITGGLGAEACAQILKVPLEELEPIIADLKEGGLLQSDPDRPARIMITPRGVAELQMRNAWREVCAEIADVASALDEGQNLEACTLLLGFINTLLNSSQSSGAVACYGLVLRLLGQWSPAGAASGQKQAFMKLALAACDISMYLSKSHRQAREIAARALETAKEQGDARMTALLHLVESSLENMAAECSAQRMHELHAQCETSLLELDRAGARGQAEYFVGMFHFWHGHFREALAAFEVALQYPQLWECRFQTEMFSLYTSSSAVYLGRFHQAVGILEAAKRAAELGQNRFKILWWEGQLAMVLLYMRRRWSSSTTCSAWSIPKRKPKSPYGVCAGSRSIITRRGTSKRRTRRCSGRWTSRCGMVSAAPSIPIRGCSTCWRLTSRLGCRPSGGLISMRKSSGRSKATTSI